MLSISDDLALQVMHRGNKEYNKVYQGRRSVGMLKLIKVRDQLMVGRLNCLESHHPAA